jgi:hypothetical protein
VCFLASLSLAAAPSGAVLLPAPQSPETGAAVATSVVPPTPEQAFQDRATVLFQSIPGWWDRREWNAAIEEHRALLKEFELLSPEEKKAKRSLASDIAYSLACALARGGKPAEAVATLKTAVDTYGRLIHYGEYAHWKQDTDLDSLRDRTDFAALLERLRGVGDYRAVLRSAPDYPAAADPNAPPVRYQDAKQAELRALRERYRLEEVAGKGNEVSRLKNLMLWVNRQVAHDGSAFPPTVRNAAALLEGAKQQKDGLNCRMMSTILNDVLLAEGFATRHVACMPRNPDDPDCHVVNAVWCKSLGKWVWMDASFAGYWTDEAGQLLGIEEMRERVRAGKPVKAAATLHHNADRYTEAEYLDYMTKNMYWFVTPIESRFDCETAGGVRYLALVPPGGKQGWSKEGDTYYTSDPAAFWRKP